VVYYQLGAVGNIIMKKYSTILAILFSICPFVFSFSQSEQCGTMQNLEFQLQKDPSLRRKLDSIELNNSNWIKNNNRGFKEHKYSNQNNRTSNAKSNLETESTNALCSYDNTLFTNINAPTILGQIVSPTNNCTWAGEYVRVNNLIAGNTYRISTIGLNNFDTVLSIFLAGGGNPVAYNDDWNGSAQSEIYFTPFISGNYDILIDEYGCLSNQLCASLQVELWYIPRPVITIPVVVHVIHNGENIGVGANISDAQIQSQIDILNQDFRRLNSDVLFSPAPFRGSSADPLIQFCLAQQKPDGTSTNGINRMEKPTEQEYIGVGMPLEYRCLNDFTIETFIKPATIWDRDKYLNIWVSDLRESPQEGGCSVQSSTLGYAQFPGIGGQFSPTIPAHLTDGVWIRNDVFGSVGNLNPNFNLGRTATHEIGHWLSLRHVWGDEPECNQDDFVIDTPIQSVKSGGCNTFPHTDSCSTLFPGIMFMNYMDYSNDNCLSIFTFGQSARMDSALFNQRAGLLTSNGCQPSTLGLNNNLLENGIKAYPNPFINQLTIEANEPIHEVEIYNLLGQKVKNFIINNPTENLVNIDLSELAQGNYLAKIYTELNEQSIKIMKN
jgi:hypothetical protein